jgi:ribosome biogenesis GTPase A
VIHEFRAGGLGRITLETPQEYALWLAQGQAIDAARLARKQALEATQGRRPARPAQAAKGR